MAGGSRRSIRGVAVVAVAACVLASTHASGPDIDPGTVFDGRSFTAARASWYADFALTDLDGDGRIDLFLPASLAGGVLRYRSDGHRFGSPEAIDVPGLSPAIRAADLDDDGDDDLVVMGRYGLVTTLWNEGGALVATPSLNVLEALGVEPTILGWETPLVVRTQANDAGPADWSLLTPSEFGTLEVMLGADGAPTDVVVIHPTPSRAIAIGDLDGDAAPDLLVGTRPIDGVVLRAEVDPKTGDWGPFEPFDGVPAGAITTGDLDLDGHEDVLIAVGPLQDPEGPVRVLLGDGRGGATLVDELERPAGQPSLAVGDLDGDTWPEIVVGKISVNDAALQVWRGGPGGASERWFSRGSEDQVGSIQLADVTGDDRLDVVLTGGGELQGAVVLVGRQGAPPGHETSRLGEGTTSRPYWLFPGTPSELPFIARRDQVDGASILTLMRNRGDGTFTDGPAIEGLALPWKPPEIVAAAEPFTHLTAIVGVPPGRLRVLRRQHDSVEEVAEVPVADETTRAILVDLDADGDLDIVSTVQDEAVQRLELRLQQPDWEFQLSQTFDLSGFSPDGFFASASDVDGDGQQDVLLQRAGVPPRVCWSIGDGTVASSVVLDVPFEFSPPRSVHVIDADGDGRQDLLLVQYDDTVGVARQVRPRAFESVGTIPAPTWDFSPFPEAIGDIDGDGDLDAVGDDWSQYGPLRWLENVSVGDAIAFVERRAWRRSVEFGGVLDLADMNGDGRADVVRRSTELRVIRSLPPVPTWRADVTADGVVDMADLAAVLDRWGSIPFNSPYIIAADVDRDHQVEYADLIAVLATWGAPGGGQ